MDENRIAQVVTNLLSNALKFTPARGEVVLRVGECPERPGSVLVSVTDTGRGIEQEQLDRVFDRLYQARRSDAALHGGLGLGLSICRELVALHGGDIWVESQPGRGSTFAFTLPACEPSPAAEPTLPNEGHSATLVSAHGRHHEPERTVLQGSRLA
jgi:signal transduction histidine kinase